MGLTSTSTGNKVLNEDIESLKEKCDYVVAIAGNPNVGKSTIFNGLTGMHQHTGNWPGKTVANAAGICKYKDKNFLLVDIPGTYSLMSNSEEEEIARNYICFGNSDATVVILDATCLERSLNLAYQIMEITTNIIVCVNLLDEAEKKGIHIDLKELENILGVPVVGTIARKKKTLSQLMKKVKEVCERKQQINQVSTLKQIRYLPYIEECINLLQEEIEEQLPEDKKYLARWIAIKLIDKEEKIIETIEEKLNIDITSNKEINEILERIKGILANNGVKKEEIKDKIISSIIFKAETICQDIIEYENVKYNERDRKIDKILTSKKWGIPIMLAFLGVIFWLTITGANYPSQLLSQFFGWLQEKIVYVFDYIGAPVWLKGILIDGMYRTLTWVIAVMLPPMAIFFPMFTILEDLGYLPRLSFNLDKYFRKAGSSRKASTNHVHGIWM